VLFKLSLKVYLCLMSLQAMLDNGQARSRAELARLLPCSRAWVTKVWECGLTSAE